MSNHFPVSRTEVSPVVCRMFGSLRMTSLFLAVLTVGLAHGEEWYWRGTAQDAMSAEKDGSGKPLWEKQNNPGTYGIPTTSDTVILNNGSVATLRKTDESWLNQLQGIYVNDGASTLIVDVGDNDTLSLSGTLGGNGTVRKTGGGILRLAYNSSTAFTDASYFLDTRDGQWIVEAGTLATPNYNSSYLWSSYRHFGRMIVRSGAVLAIGTEGQNVFKGLWGDGVVTNSLDGTSNCMLGIRDDERTGRSVFGGKITGTVRIMPFGPIDFTGTSSDTTGQAVYKNNADIGVMLFGATDSSAGSLGGSMAYLNGANIAFRYLGESGERTAMTFSTENREEARSLVFDGGAHGGLELAGTIRFDNAKIAKYHKLIEFTGSNTTACTLSTGTLTDLDDMNGATYLRKSGTGRWNITSDIGIRGTVAVEGGTLGVATIAAISNNCSLGRMMTCQEPYIGENQNRDVDYGLLLGSALNPASRTTLEYMGATPVVCSTREIGLAGTGVVRSADDAGTLDWTGAHSVTSSGGTIVLSGDGTGGESVFRRIVDGEGVVSVVKEGSGTWCLSSDQGFTGDLMVTGGTLRVFGAGGSYTWFKITFRGNYANNVVNQLDRDISFRKIGFYDAQGARQNTNMTFVAGAARDSDNRYFPDLSSIQPGQYGWFEPGADGPSDGGKKYYNYFGARDVDNTFSWEETAYPATIAYVKINENAFKTNNPNSWISLLVRMPETANPVRSFDIASPGSPTYRSADFWSVYGSRDGLNWDLLKEYNMDTGHYTAAHWMSNGDALSYDPEDASNTRRYDPDDASSKGFPVTTVDSGDALSGARSVSVWPGAKLVCDGTATTSCLVLDAATGGGEIENLTLAPSGLLKIINMNTQVLDVSAAFQKLELVNPEAMRSWTAVKVGSAGHPDRELRLAVSGSGRITVSTQGMIFILR